MQRPRVGKLRGNNTMTIKAQSNYGNQDILTIADKGQECRIDVDVGRKVGSYSDTINIITYNGDISISGKHVHELMRSILRFSSPRMLQIWIRFALLTNKAAGNKDIDFTLDYFDFDDYDIEHEQDMRKIEMEWNANYFRNQEETQ
jgi:hypothetical protein